MKRITKQQTELRYILASLSTRDITDKLGPIEDFEEYYNVSIFAVIEEYKRNHKKEQDNERKN